MDVCLKNKYIGNKGQARDSCYGIVFNIIPVFVWLLNITGIYTIWHYGHYNNLFNNNYPSFGSPLISLIIKT